MQVQGKLVDLVRWHVSHGQCSDVLEINSRVVWLETIHLHGLGGDVETVGNAAWNVAEDLLCSVGGADDEGVVEGETETNLD